MNFYPHHIGDYITATAHLTWLEDCAYRRLLDTYYTREQCLPADVGQVCRLVRAATKDERKAVETVLNEFFKPGPGGWVHGRCEHEIEKARVAAERAKANGMKGGRPRKLKPSTNPEETQSVISGFSGETQTEPNPKAPITNTNTPSLRSGEARTRATVPSRPDEVDEQTWIDWLTHRKAKKAPVTQTVLDTARHEAEKAGMPLGRFLTLWCARGSQGLMADWLTPEERGIKSAPVGSEPAWRTEQRQRTAQAVPGLVAGGPDQTVIDVEARNVPAFVLGG